MRKSIQCITKGDATRMTLSADVGGNTGDIGTKILVTSNAE